MSVFKAAGFRSDGRIAGCFVYMILCDGPDSVYVKVGLSDSPIARLRAIRTGCPFVPQLLACVELCNRKAAKRLESDLHSALKDWHSHLEWFSIALEDKKAFNSAWKPVLDRHSTPSRKLAWTYLSVEELAKQWSKSARFVRMQYAKYQ